MRIGVLGGTFDPPHLAHVIVAQEVLELVGLDKILFIPTGSPPLKPRGAFAGAEDRARMLELAVAGNPAFEVSWIEVHRPGVSYTADTLQQLHERYPAGTELFFIVGADQIRQLRDWYAPERVLELARLVVMTRSGYSLDLGELDRILPGTAARAILAKVTPIGISATEIRRRLASGRSIRYLVPEAVWRYIDERGLYRDGHRKPP